MKERQILMKAGPVNAILAGRQTQDRRPVKLQPIPSSGQWSDLWIVKTDGKRKGMSCVNATEWDVQYWCKQWCPYQVGDHLWVRETFVLESNFNLGSYPPPFGDGRPIRWVEDPHYGKYWQQPHYRATDPTPELYYPDREDSTVKWTPSIHMPRWACRIELGITGVRVERIKDTSFDDAIAEGCPMEHMHDERPPVFADGTLLHQGIVGPVAWFADLWDSIYAKQGLGWDMNPWVWVLDFKVV